MKDAQKDNLLVKVRNWVLQFTSTGGGIKNFSSLLSMVLVFSAFISYLIKDILIILVPFMAAVVYYIFRFSEKFFGLAKDPETRILFFPPSQMIAAYKFDRLNGDDTKSLKEIKADTPLFHPVFKELSEKKGKSK
ncbi:MAG: hypothetical protein ABH819_03460 [Patescibacteria group bacterium]